MPSGGAAISEELLSMAKRLKLTSKALLLAVALMPSSVNAFCSEPSMYTTPPDPPSSWSKPNPPYCLSGYSYSDTHTCDRWEIDGFIDEVTIYIDELNDYVREANAYANEAIEYANAASRYAQCEAEDVQSELR